MNLMGKPPLGRFTEWNTPMPSKNVRPIQVDGNIARLILTHGHTAIIDADDVHLVQKWNWCTTGHGKWLYASRIEKSGGKCKFISLHRFLMCAPKGMMVDHISGDGFDCRRANMRLATPSENARNQRRHHDNKGGIKGVYFDESRRKWRAQIMVDGRYIFIGRYDDIDAARSAYASASAMHHGEFGVPK